MAIKNLIAVAVIALLGCVYGRIVELRLEPVLREAPSETGSVHEDANPKQLQSWVTLPFQICLQGFCSDRLLAREQLAVSQLESGASKTDLIPQLLADTLNITLKAQTPDISCISARLVRKGSAASSRANTATRCWTTISPWRPVSQIHALLPMVRSRVANMAPKSQEACTDTEPRKVVILGGLGSYDGMKRMLIWQIEALLSNGTCPFEVDYVETACRWRNLPSAFAANMKPAADVAGAMAIDATTVRSLLSSRPKTLVNVPTVIREALRAGARFVSICSSINPDTMPRPQTTSATQSPTQAVQELLLHSVAQASSLTEAAVSAGVDSQWIHTALKEVLQLFSSADVVVMANHARLASDLTLLHLARLVRPTSHRVLALGGWPILDPRLVHSSRHEAYQLVTQLGADAGGFSGWMEASKSIQLPRKTITNSNQVELMPGAWSVADHASTAASQALLQQWGTIPLPVTCLQAPSMHVANLPGTRSVSFSPNDARPAGSTMPPASELVITSVDTKHRWNASRHSLHSGVAQQLLHQLWRIACAPSGYWYSKVVTRAALVRLRGMISGCDDQTPPSSSDPAAELRNLQATNAIRTVLFTGRLSAVKGVGTALAAISSLSQLKKLDVVPVFMFVTQPKVKELFHAVRSYISRLGLGQAVLLRGYVTPDAVPALLLTADIVLAPFLNPVTETLGLSPLEAMALQRPVIHCAVGGMQDYTEPDGGANAVPSSLVAWHGCTPQGVAIRLEQALRAPRRWLAKVGVRARNIVIDLFSDDLWHRVLRSSYMKNSV